MGLTWPVYTNHVSSSGPGLMADPNKINFCYQKRKWITVVG